MLESVSHRFRTIAYDAQLAGDRQVALRLVQEWLGDDTAALPAARVPMIRYANGERFELRLDEVDEIERAEKGAAFRRGATYLMVGALGPAGASICEELGRRYGARLVIFSRRTEAAVRPVLSRIAAAGATVVYRSVDILDRPALDRAMQAIKADGIEIHGVIHLARQVSDAPITAKPFRAFAETLAAKVDGTAAIDAATADEPLEFFLMYSSLAAFGLPGSPDYAFSAAFQNAFARHRNRLVQHGLRSGSSRSICWGQWAVDGAIDAGKLPARLVRLGRLGIGAIDADAAMHHMDACLAGRREVTGFLVAIDKRKARHAAGLTGDGGEGETHVFEAIAAFAGGEWSAAQFAAFLDRVPDRALSPAAQKEIARLIASGPTAPARDAFPAQATPTAAPAGPVRIGVHPPSTSAVERALVAGVQRVLKIQEAEIDWNEPLPNYGLDSILAMQLATTLEQTLNFAIQPKWLVEFSTLHRLREKLNEEQQRNPNALR